MKKLYDSPLTPLGQRIEEARVRLRISQNELERRAGLGRGYVSQIVTGTRGKRMTVDVMARLARALEVDSDWLAGNEREDGTELRPVRAKAPAGEAEIARALVEHAAAGRAGWERLAQELAAAVLARREVRLALQIQVGGDFVLSRALELASLVMLPDAPAASARAGTPARKASAAKARKVS